jgi:hypothetical protein
MLRARLDQRDEAHAQQVQRRYLEAIVVVFAPIKGLMELGRLGISGPESFGFLIIDSFTVPDRDKK